jgi:cation-dependent mannose-6-phosphate receptor
MRLCNASILLASLPLALAASTPDPLKPCTARSPSGLFYDLNSMAAVLPDHDGELRVGERNTSWVARGYDYGTNFTLNFCAPVVEELDHVDGVDTALWKNISAFYQRGFKTYSLGQLSTEPVFRGRKFVLNYTDGSPCGGDEADNWLGSSDSDAGPHGSRVHQAAGSSASSPRRKSALVSLLCDRDTADSTRPKVAVSFVGWSPDECSYYFEARSQYVCGGSVSEPQTVGPGSVLSAIVLITLAVYILGGVAYQRIVMHQRGWRQFPNYAMWASVASFFWVSINHLWGLCFFLSQQ